MATLVLLPGLEGTGELFDPFLKVFGDRTRTQVVRYPTDVVLGYDEHQDFVRKALPVDEPYVLFGESFSGPIAIALAAEAPPSLKGLVLCCTFARNPRPGLAGARVLLPFIPLLDMPPFALSHLLLGKFRSPALLSAISRAVEQVRPAVLRARLQAVLCVDSSALLARVRVPSIYLQASEDRLIPKSALAHIQAVCPSVAAAKIEAPHCLLQSSPDAAASAISSFMRELAL
ncbi:alpha/beta hydrolase [Variovorax rhizosphaerae]|uniref:Alpha/beta hydrolase n=1 Tax=Variovorax rhizosphaerae TaxID=1836200 RepID=A0ABU8WDT6_9BURK